MDPARHRLLEQLDEEALSRQTLPAARVAVAAKGDRTGQPAPELVGPDPAPLPRVIPALREAAVNGKTTMDLVVDSVLGRTEARASAAEQEAARVGAEVDRMQGVVRDAEAASRRASEELARVMSLHATASTRAEAARTAVKVGDAAAAQLPSDVAERLRTLGDAWPT